MSRYVDMRTHRSKLTHKKTQAQYGLRNVTAVQKKTTYGVPSVPVCQI